MTVDDRNARIEAIAAKALMLAPGGVFAVPVSGGNEEAAWLEGEVEDAFERQYHYGCQMVPNLAHPDELATRIVTSTDAAHLIIERVPESQKYMP